MRLALRTRVLAATLALVTVGLAAAGFATYGFLRPFLVHRLDQQLESSLGPADSLVDAFLHLEQGGGPQRIALHEGWYIALLDQSGNLVTDFWYRAPFKKSSHPKLLLPSGLPGSSQAGQEETVVAFTTRPAEGRSTAYRAVAEEDARLGGTLVVGVPLTEVSATLHRLVFVELAVAGAVLLAVGGLGWWLVRLGLRPLDRMAETAGAIAAGDLSRRVEPDDGQTEVGRLGFALNTMLGQIETSFAEQRASEERLRRFVADASHELRTPITSIRGYAELFRRGASTRPEDLERAMRRIEDEGARMGLLVDDLLLLARLDQGRPLEREPVDLVALVSDAVGDARAADPTRLIELSSEGPGGVMGDELRLRQVFANLLDNARTHTPPGTPVSVRLSRSGDGAVVEVSDRGPGLSPEESSKAFERFYRGDPSRSRSSGGTGLGLSIAAAIVRAHGGHISLSSTPGVGATVVVSLPLSTPSEPESLI